MESVKINQFKLTACASLVALAVNATAQEQQQSTEDDVAKLEVIQVTAQKRVEPLQETPIAVTAFTPGALDKKGIDDISKLAEFAPNLVFDTQTAIGGGSSAAAVFIRGIGNTDFSLTTDPGVGTYIDGVYVSRSIGGILDVLDVSGVEVLRGPQGTLFGRNTIGGAINITSRKPYDEIAGQAQVTVGNFSRLDFRGSIDIPITTELGSTFALAVKERDGFVDRPLVGDTLGGQDRFAFRGSFYYEPTDSLTLQLAFDVTDYDEESAPGVSVGFTPGAGVVGTALRENPDLPLGPAIGTFLDELEQFVVAGEDDISFGTSGNRSTVEAEGVSFIATYAGDSYELKYTGAYRQTDATFDGDADASPFQITNLSNPNYQHEQTSHELQITGNIGDAFKYVGGVFFFEEEGEDVVFVDVTLPQLIPGTFDLAFGPDFIDPVAPGVSDARAFEGTINNFATVDNSSEAYYFQGTYAVTDELNVTAGIRHTIDDKGYGFTQVIAADSEANPLPFLDGVPVGGVLGDGTFQQGIIPIVGNGSGDAEESFEETTYKFGVDYQLPDDTLLYYSFSQGFKSGGFVLRYVAAVPEPIPFDQETLDAHEFGVKWESDNKRIRVNGALFYTDYSDVQVTFFDEGGGPITANAGEATIQGLELEVSALITEDLLFELGYGYTDAQYDTINEIPGLALTITEDSALVNTPENTLNASLEYNVELGENQLLARIDYAYSDDIFNDSQNSPFLFQDAYGLLNASITYTYNYDWDITLFVENITDERVIETGNSNFGLGFHEARFNRPTEYGLTVRYKF